MLFSLSEHWGLVWSQRKMCRRIFGAPTDSAIFFQACLVLFASLCLAEPAKQLIARVPSWYSFPVMPHDPTIEETDLVNRARLDGKGPAEGFDV
jgi:hypothetical protein